MLCHNLIMDLFHVERFYGEDSVEQELDTENQKSIEDTRLKEFKKKIRKRKKQQAEQHGREVESDKKDGDRTRKKVKKINDVYNVAVEIPETDMMYENSDKAKKENIDAASIAIGPVKLKDVISTEMLKENTNKIDLIECKEKQNENSNTDVEKSSYKNDTDELCDIGMAEDKQSNNNDPEQSNKVKDEYFTVLGNLSKKQKVKPELRATLPKWLAEPRQINANINSGKVHLSNVPALSLLLIKKLTEQGIEYLFPVQATVIPFIVSQMQTNSALGRMGFLPSDICVSAPTGSGKTLAYVLPIIQTISKCIIRRLQALIILPTKDLANQIKNVFDKFVGGTNIRIGLACGIKSFQSEQENFIKNGPSGFMSKIDILVATPGRLVDHITQTEGFTLEHLRFLVIDEADRLLSQSYHSWLEKVLNAAYKGASLKICRGITTYRAHSTIQSASVSSSIQLPLQKLLFSATLTQSPEKLAPLQLFEPILFAASERIERMKDDLHLVELEDENEKYITPENLTEKMAICSSGEKPLILIYLMKVLQYKGVLCFTGSIEATHRLFLLLKAYGDLDVAEFSSTLNQTQRKGILRDFKSGKVNLLICSDAMARGMDIENIEVVVSYDPPANIKTYVHRVGRTARAGQKGIGITILSPKEIYHFKKIVKKTNKTSISKLKISNDDLEPLANKYQEVLQSLEETIKAEKAHAHKFPFSKSKSVIKDPQDGKSLENTEI